jgi:hypothetical protein
VAQALAAVGDYSGTPDGRAARLLYFGDSDGLPGWYRGIAEAASGLSFVESVGDYRTRSSLFEGSDYANFSTRGQGGGGQGGNPAAGAGGSDLLGGALRNLSQPFAEALRKEGYGFDLGTYLARHGLGESQRPLIESAFAPLLDRRQNQGGPP